MNLGVLDPCSRRSVVFAMNDRTAGHAFASILDARGHVCATADSLIEAIETSDCDVLVAEFGDSQTSSPPIDGLELLANLQSSGEQRPYTILVARNATPEDYRQAILLGVDDVVERPLLPDDLVAAIEASPSSHVERRGTVAPSALRVLTDAVNGAAEAVARDLIGWCVRCEVAPPSRARIGSAVSEIVQNAVDHGARSIEVSASITGRHLDVEVVDDGPGLDLATDFEDHRFDARFGFGRAQALVEKLTVRTEEGRGTRVRLRFGVTTLDLEDDHGVDLSDLDFFAPATSKELLATLNEEPDAPVMLSPALAVVVGRLLTGPDPRRVLRSTLGGS
ncbi:MAG: ATP-binding protein [Planctomycetota bacterium]